MWHTELNPPAFHAISACNCVITPRMSGLELPMSHIHSALHCALSSVPDTSIHLISNAHFSLRAKLSCPLIHIYAELRLRTRPICQGDVQSGIRKLISTVVPLTFSLIPDQNDPKPAMTAWHFMQQEILEP